MKKLLIFFSLLILFTSITLPSVAFADQTLLSEADCFYRGTATLDCVAPLFANLIYWLIVLAGTVAVFFIILGGIKFLTSSGDQQKVEGAKKTLTWAIIGLVVILSSFMIVNIVADLTGVNCITKFGFRECGLPDVGECGGNRPGTCGTGQACLRSGTNYHCVTLCSSTNKNGYCAPSSGRCVKISATNWGCRLKCNDTNKERGFCAYPQICQKESGSWVCKTGG